MADAPTTTTGTNWGANALWGVALFGVGALAVTMFLPDRVFSNPLGTVNLGSGDRPRRKRLIAKGHSCLFEMEDGRDIRVPGGMLHDPSGHAWPSRSVLCGPFQRGSEVEPADGDERAYLGRDPKMGVIDTPPRELDGWSYVGDVERIYYTRIGNRADRYQHGFNESFFHHKGRVRLYRRGRYYRLELPRGAVLDARGFVRP